MPHSIASDSRRSISVTQKNKKAQKKSGSLCSFERVTGIEPVSQPWQGYIITIIRYPPNSPEAISARQARLKTPFSDSCTLLKFSIFGNTQWDWLESNQRPSDYESPALTPELQSQSFLCIQLNPQYTNQYTMGSICCLCGAGGQN